MILNRARKECPSEIFTVSVVKDMENNLKNLNDIYFPVTTKVELLKRLGYCAFSGVAAASFTHAATQKNCGVHLMGLEIPPDEFFGVASSIFYANMLKESYALYKSLFPFKKLSSQELDSLVTEAMKTNNENELTDSNSAIVTIVENNSSTLFSDVHNAHNTECPNNISDHQTSLG